MSEALKECEEVPHGVAEPHAEEVVENDGVPEELRVEQPDEVGDTVPDEDRQADAVPQGVGEIEVDREVVPE